MSEYAVYKGEELIVVGTAEECAETLGVKAESIRWYSTPTAHRRLAKRKNPDRCQVVMKIEDEEDD